MRAKYDVIIIGGGVAGLVAAARLSEDATKTILVVEAGKDRRGDPFVDTPGMLIATWGNRDYDWDFWTTTQASLGGRQLPQPRGRLLGGSSAINAMAMLYPSPRDLQAWVNLGNHGWAPQDLAPYYSKSTKFFPPSHKTMESLGLNAYYQPELYGTDGPVSTSIAEGSNQFDEAFINALDGTGLSQKRDPILGIQRGPFTPSSSVDPNSRKRSYAAEGYYTNMIQGRDNVDLLIETHVDKLILDGSRGENDLVEAKGVVVIRNDGSIQQILGDDVILAAGSLQTPLVLERSGIGRRDVLSKNGIEVSVENPGVGENLQDHVFTSISMEVADGLVTRDAARDPAVVAAFVKEYSEKKSGPLASVPLNYAVLPPVDGSGCISATELVTLSEAHVEPSDSSPIESGLNAQHSELRNMLHSGETCAMYLGIFAGQTVINLRGRTSMVEAHTPLHPQNFLTISVGLNRPMSRGSVHIGGKDAEVVPGAAGPIIDPSYLSHALDQELLARGLQFVKSLAQTEDLKKVLKPNGVVLPPAAADVSDMAVAKRISSERAWSNYHPVGTCAMMPRDLGGVVSDRLVVYGMKNVRVIDASVFPMIPMGNIQATVYAVAEKACDLIKEDWAQP
ncbi:hypothetical protein QQS21_006465 [Conoideocrella luteorostrata]|uniref:Glucose-methanol-choline oxidoreductase N-terminal domain-containing protein n=1 Tax=Conoideocrella luteorostrata TaxID=1105319 RepID=A0AAJ0CMJ3_9HYPO|nr:hypothetical protein QQS21_006465 [Conoideocrella luteorostrata]